MLTQHKLPWHDPDWMKQAHEWIRAQTARQSIHITGAIKQPHNYAWSTILHIPTNEGTLFFKATAPETLFEVGLTQMLANLYPDCMPEPVAVDTARGWMLMRHGGKQLRTIIRPRQDISPWNPVILCYAKVQVGLASHVSDLLALGVPDYRLAILPALYTQLLGDEESLMIGQEKGLTSNEVRQLQKLTPRFEQICSELAALGIPESINHGDFHDGNVLIKDGRITLLDWADACVSHPFVSLRTFFVSIEMSLKLEEYSFTPEMSALLDIYLEPWQKFASKEVLLTAYRLSKPVASIVKARNWYLTISNIEQGPLRDEYAWIVPELLKEFMMHEKTLAD